MNPVTTVVNQLKKRDPQAIFLFGSHAWGNPNRDSDVDVMIVEKTPQDHATRMKEIYLLLDGRVPTDVIALDRAQLSQALSTNSFYRQIVNKGKLMYGNL